MKKLLTCLTLLMCLVLVAFEEPKSDAVTLRWKLETGQLLRYRSELIQTQKTGDTLVTTRVGVVLRQVVRGISKDGVVSMDLTHDAIRMSVDGPAPVNYDSTRKGGDAKFNDLESTKVLAPLLDVRASMTMDPTGKIIELKGMSEAMEKVESSLETDSQRRIAEGIKHLFQDDALRQILEYNVFPAKSIAVDSTWSRKVEIEGSFGTMTVEYDYALTRVEKRGGIRVADIALKAKTTVEKDKKTAPVGVSIHTTAAELAGSMSFAIDSGRMTRLVADSSLTMRVTMPGPPAKDLETEIEFESEATMHQVIALLGEGDPAFE